MLLAVIILLSAVLAFGAYSLSVILYTLHKHHTEDMSTLQQESGSTASPFASQS